VFDWFCMCILKKNTGRRTTRKIGQTHGFSTVINSIHSGIEIFVITVDSLHQVCFSSALPAPQVVRSLYRLLFSMLSAVHSLLLISACCNNLYVSNNQPTKTDWAYYNTVVFAFQRHFWHFYLCWQWLILVITAHRT